MVNDHPTRNRILIKAKEQFLRYGFSKVTMDELAANLGISKRTLYDFFATKEQLLSEVIKSEINTCKSAIESIMNKESSFSEKFKQILEVTGTQIAQINRSILQDFQNNTPQIWEEIMDFRQKTIIPGFKTFLDEGIKKNLIRSDINVQVILLIYFSAIQNIMNPDIMLQLPVPAEEIHEMIIKVLFNGIMINQEVASE